MRLVTLLNEKGGVGKTTLATHISAGLAIKGHRVVLVDADPQGHATVIMGLKKEPGLYDLLVRNAPFTEVMRPISPEMFSVPDCKVKGKLFVVPSNIETRNIANSIDDALYVRERFMQLQDTIDMVVFDTSPTPSLLHGSIALATDSIIIPTFCEMLSFDGLRESLVHRDSFSSKKRSLGLGDVELLGIAPTRFRSNTLEHNDLLKGLHERFPEHIWNPIHDRIIWSEAARASRPVFSYAPRTKAAEEAWSLVDRAEEALNRVTA